MSTRRLASVPLSLLALLSGMSVLVVPGPVAALEPGPREPTSIAVVIAVGGSTPVAGTARVFNATLSSNSGPVEGATVRLLGRSTETGRVKELGTDVTGASGKVRITATLWRNSRVRFVYAGDATYAPSDAGPFYEVTGARVRASLGQHRAASGEEFPVTGRTTPSKAGNRVFLYRGTTSRGASSTPSTQRPRRLDTSVVRDDGTFALVGRLYGEGRRRLFVQVARDRTNAVGWSPYRRITLH